MPLLALTGGIASGKSTIAARLRSHGAVIVDADRIVHELQAPGTPLVARIGDEFGAGVVRADGSLDRSALASRVFGHPDRVERLNRLVHPAVHAESSRRFRAAFDADPDAVVVYDVPLLAEARAGDVWDLVVAAEAPAAMRRDRLVRERGMSVADAQARIGSQATDARRRELADVVIDTSGTLADTLAQADRLWERVAPTR